jgi:3-(3-hydroxy-phenyl)propionate hydroxylase
MTAILFCEGAPTAEQALLLTQLGKIDKRFVALPIARQGSAFDAKAIADTDGEIARLFAAETGALYLLRPDLHIAGRWKTAVPSEIVRTARVCLGSERP